jgi:hypothetical protein
MKMFFVILVVVIGLIVLAAIVYGRERIWERMTGPADLGRYDFTEGRRSGSPNDALACTEGACTAPDITIATPDRPLADIVARVAERLEAIEAHVRRVDDRNNPLYARFVIYTPLMRFPDTLDIEVAERSDGAPAIRAYSRSKLGRSDLGTNRKRLEALFDIR